MAGNKLTIARGPLARCRTAALRAPAVAAVALLPLTSYGPLQHAEACPQVTTTSHVVTQAARVATRLVDASPADRARVEAAATGPDRPYVLEAFAAGHSADEVVRFAELIRGRSPDWLSTHLSLIDPAEPGPVTYNGSRVRQTDETTCGSMVILMARAIADPLYTLYLTTGDSNDPAEATAARFHARLVTEEHRIHEATNTFWPQRLGSTPAGVSGELNRHADALGTRYDVRLIGRARGNPALRDAVTAAQNGQPVPVLIGNWIPRHYVLLIGRDEGDLLVYEPTKGRVVRVGVQAFLDGSVSALAYQHVKAVITPSDVTR